MNTSTKTTLNEAECGNKSKPLLGEVLYYRGCYKEKHYDLEIESNGNIYCLYAIMIETETHPFFVSLLRFKQRYKMKRSEKKQIRQIATEFCLKNFA